MAKTNPFWRASRLLLLLAVMTIGIVVYTLDRTRVGGSTKLWAAWKSNATHEYAPSSSSSSSGSSSGGGYNYNHNTADDNHNNAEDDHNAEDNEKLAPTDGEHPITQLMSEADKVFEKVLSHEADSLRDAAAKYRARRGRHPPVGFEKWYAYAIARDAVVVEAFWDQIYDDLAPFWSIEPLVLRKRAHVFSNKISVRGGEVLARSYNVHSKMGVWKDMVKTLMKDAKVDIGDVDIPLNVNEEPAMLVPWETIDTAVSMSRKMMLPAEDVVTEYSNRENITNLTIGFDFDPEWQGPRLTHPDSWLGPRPLWSLVRPACPPRSPTRLEHVFNDIWTPNGGTSEAHSALGLLPLELPAGTLQGYAKNWSATIDACQWPNVQGLHGAFVAPEQMGVTTKLFPLFGDSKLSVSNEILLPGGREWNASLTANETLVTPWQEKQDKLFWRGKATRGHHMERYWQRFHRERFVAMMNATHVEIGEAAIHTGNETTVGAGYANNFRLLPANEYNLTTQAHAHLAEWVNGWANVELTELACKEHTNCSYLERYFSTAGLAPTMDQANYKYAISLDGNGGDDGGDFVRHLMSGRVTLRASMYQKWYDSRVVPWLHFVPIDSTLVDVYGVMEYFLGTDVSDEAREFAHAVGEVQTHEHHFKTPGEASEVEGMEEEEKSSLESNPRVSIQPHFNADPPFSDDDVQDGNEPHNFSHDHNVPRQLKNDDSRDAAAHKIAQAGQDWARKVLRREDMLIYVYRLLLEYARIMDDKRDRLGWVTDLLEEAG